MRARLMAAAVLVILAGCGKEAPPASAPKGPAPGALPADGEKPLASGLPADLLLKAAPAGARSLKEVKASAKEGEEVVFRARVGGVDSPFVAGRASMTVADQSFPACTERPGDTCATPWDFCCESLEDLAAGTATIEVAGPDGRPLRAGLEGLGGIKALSRVVVRGVVGPRPDPKVFVVRATGIFLE